MKKQDWATVILIAGFSVLVAYLIANLVIGSPKDMSARVPTMEEISGEVVDPSKEIFNGQAINPTVEVFTDALGQESTDGSGS